ncbi:hypothetical protein D6T65_04955 [Arthrobacter frigidicola]|nr:hypothetical protein D6T65_04955 [Arthrobacter frigidicola]
MDWWIGIIIALITGAVSVIGVRYTSKSTVKVKELEVDASAYDRAERIYNSALSRLDSDIQDLRTRSTAQEAEITKLRDGIGKVTAAFRVAMNFIEQFLLWERDGSAPPRPSIPDSLKEYLDPQLIREHIRQQAQDDRQETT